MRNEEAFLQKRLDKWRRLDELSNRASSGPRRLTGPELVEYVRLYRQASADLAYMRTHSSNQSVVDYLNTLVARGFGNLYRHKQRSLNENIRSGLLTSAITFRQNARFILFSFAILVLGAVWGWVLVAHGSQTRRFVIPPMMEANVDYWKSGAFEAPDAQTSLAATGMYLTNNPLVALRSIGLAVGTAGIGGVMIMWQNGSILGGLSAEMQSVNKLGFLHSSIWSHGVSEIGGFIIAGAAGFVLAWALLFPGRRTRMDALADKGKQILALTITSVVMIFIAAPIEGFFSFNRMIPQPAKVVLALFSLVAYTWFFGFYGRDQEADQA